MLLDFSSCVFIYKVYNYDVLLLIFSLLKHNVYSQDAQFKIVFIF